MRTIFGHARQSLSTPALIFGGASKSPLTTAGILCLLIGCGWAIGAEHVRLLLLAVALLGLGILALSQRGTLVGILVLAGLNGVPFFDTSKLVTSKLAIEDIAVIGLLFVAAVWVLIDGAPPAPTKVGRVVSRLGMVLLVWSSYVMARTLIDESVPILRALYFGRDFLLFGSLLIVLPRVRFSLRDISTLLGILAVGVCIFAVGQIMTALGIGQPGSLIHFKYTLAESGLNRVYSNMTDLVTATLAVAIAATLLSRQRMLRLSAAPIAVLLLVSTIVQLTRARWIGLIIGVVVISFWLAISSNTTISATLRRRLTLFVSLLAFIFVVAIVTVPSVVSGGAVIHRLTSIFSDLQSGSGTVAIREQVTNTMTALLGQRWPSGLGFVPPFTHYYAGLPGGSIRDPDVGVLNAVMTMGVVGAALIYLPVIIVFGDCLRRLSLRRGTNFGWLYYGGAIWMIATLSSSVTLITLFSTSGLALAAVFLTILAGLGASDQLSAISVADTSEPEPRAESAVPSLAI
jgi:hypothetical protein